MKPTRTVRVVRMAKDLVKKVQNQYKKSIDAENFLQNINRQAEQWNISEVEIPRGGRGIKSQPNLETEVVGISTDLLPFVRMVNAYCLRKKCLPPVDIELLAAIEFKKEDIIKLKNIPEVAYADAIKLLIKALSLPPNKGGAIKEVIVTALDLLGVENIKSYYWKNRTQKKKY